MIQVFVKDYMARVFRDAIWRAMPGIDLTATNNRRNLPNGLIPCPPILRQYIDEKYVNKFNKLPMFMFQGDRFEGLCNAYKKVCTSLKIYMC